MCQWFAAAMLHECTHAMKWCCCSVEHGGPQLQPSMCELLRTCSAVVLYPHVGPTLLAVCLLWAHVLWRAQQVQFCECSSTCKSEFSQLLGSFTEWLLQATHDLLCASCKKYATVIVTIHVHRTLAWCTRDRRLSLRHLVELVKGWTGAVRHLRAWPSGSMQT